MSAKHTPGPWNVEKAAQGLVILDDAQSGTWTAIATAHLSKYPLNQGVRFISKSEAQANAHLIAAAPEMLATLKAIRATLAIDGYVSAGVEELLRTSIAKAEPKP